MYKIYLKSKTLRGEKNELYKFCFDWRYCFAFAGILDWISQKLEKIFNAIYHPFGVRAVFTLYVSGHHQRTLGEFC